MDKPEQIEDDLTDEQIKHMVTRFLGWRLPEDFSPDAGISFKSVFAGKQYGRMPYGTNLFDARQAEAMVRFMAEGLNRTPSITGEDTELIETVAKEIDRYGKGLVPHLRIVTRWLSDHFRNDEDVRQALTGKDLSRE